jgi:hypothetical protein
MSALLGALLFLIFCGAGEASRERGLLGRDPRAHAVNPRDSHPGKSGRQSSTSSEGINSIPRYLIRDTYVRGPSEPYALAVNAPESDCLTVGEVLDRVPQVSRFAQLMEDSGYKRGILDDSKVMATLVIPVDSAFDAPLEENQYGKNMTVVVEERPDIISPLIGAAIWKGLWTSDTFSPRGTQIQTSNSIGTEGSPLEVTVRSSGSGIYVDSGSMGRVLVSDLAACGPSVIHIVDTIILPFRWGDGPRDRTRLDNADGGLQQGNGGGGEERWGLEGREEDSGSSTRGGFGWGGFERFGNWFR